MAKLVYSAITSLDGYVEDAEGKFDWAEPDEREFDPEAIRQLKATAGADLSVGGAALAAETIEAGLVDEYLVFLVPVLVGGGKAFFARQRCPREPRTAGRTQVPQRHGLPPLRLRS